MNDFKKSQELKKKILADLNSWCLDPMGHLVDAESFKNRTYKDFNAYWFRFYQSDEINPNWRTEPKVDDFILVNEDYKEVKKAMINEIKNTPQDWKIEKEGDLMVVKHKSGRKHWYSEYQIAYSGDTYVGFREQEWKEIENALNKQEQKPETPSNPSSSEWQNQQEQPPNEINYMGSIYPRDK